jgi:hypothetical protein
LALLDFQTAVGRLVRIPVGEDPLHGLDLDARERVVLARLVESPGFSFTVQIQKSWCKGRAAKAAWLTLSFLATEERQRLLDKWVGAGGGTASFLATEADAFLDFIADHLPNPSHGLTVCQMEQGILRASEGVRHFVAPDPSRLDSPGCVMRLGRYAKMVRFYAEPRLLFAAQEKLRLPPLSPVAIWMLFGPGLDGLFRVATDDEVALWERLAAPTAVTVLLQEGYRREVIDALAVAGGAEHRDRKIAHF